jgi:histone deacetylase HOS2
MRLNDFPTFSDSPFFYDRRTISIPQQEQHIVQVSTYSASWLVPIAKIQPHSAPKVAYYHPQGVGNYHYGERHPMRPQRLELTNQLVLGYGLQDKMTMHAPRKATDEELLGFHDSDYIDFLRR